MGCLQCKTRPTAIRPVESEFQRDSTQARSQNTQRILEDCIIVWFRTDSSSEMSQEESNLCHILSTIKVFSNSTECLTYIKQMEAHKIFLIMSTIDSSLDSVRNLPQIEQIYILNSSLEENQNTFHNVNNLCQQFKLDLELCELDLLIVTTHRTSDTTETTCTHRKKQEAMFLYGQLKREMLLRLKFETNAKSEFINFWRLHYSNNDEHIRMINDFEVNYRAQKALQWVTHQYLIWRVLQHANRTFEVDLLFKFGFILKNAQTYLTMLQNNNSSNSEHETIFYRGKTMCKQEFDIILKDLQNGLLSFGNFFTAYSNQQKSLEFIHHRLTKFPESIGVLFQIHIPPTIQSHRSPFASLDKAYGSNNIDENGIIFGFCPVFRIDSIAESTDETNKIIFEINLSLIDDDDPQLVRLVSPYRTNEAQDNPLLIVGKLLLDIGEYQQAEQYLIGMTQDKSIRSQPRRLIRIHKGLATSYMLHQDITKALEQYQIILEISLSYLPANHMDLVCVYYEMGKCYFQLENNEKAVDNCKQAADLIGQNTPPGDDALLNEINSFTQKILENNV